MADSKWQRNAKPFIPNSSAYAARLPCCMRLLKIRWRGCLGRILKGMFVSVFTISVIFKVVFIIENSNKLRSGFSYLPNDEVDDGMDGRDLLQLESKTVKSGKCVHIKHIKLPTFLAIKMGMSEGRFTP